MQQKVSFTLNGKIITAETEHDRMLIDFLREDMRLTGAKVACREGECGACTVLLDGKPVTSCLVPVCSVEGRSVTTIEGLQKDGDAKLMMEALARFNASQCGYCTPGMVMVGVSLIRERVPAEAAIVREKLEGNLCRCTGYQKIVDAILYCMKYIYNMSQGG